MSEQSDEEKFNNATDKLNSSKQKAQAANATQSDAEMKARVAKNFEMQRKEDQIEKTEF